MTERPDGEAMDPRIARVLLRYREAVATATFEACRELQGLGLDHAAAADIIRAPVDWTRRRYPSTAPA